MDFFFYFKCQNFVNEYLIRETISRITQNAKNNHVEWIADQCHTALAIIVLSQYNFTYWSTLHFYHQITTFVIGNKR